jgi:hypothetical protein
MLLLGLHHLPDPSFRKGDPRHVPAVVQAIMDVEEKVAVDTDHVFGRAPGSWVRVVPKSQGVRGLIPTWARWWTRFPIRRSASGARCLGGLAQTGRWALPATLARRSRSNW